MARSTYIYVVTKWCPREYNGQEEIASAFTVKHELATWLRLNPQTYDTAYRVWRVGDGVHGQEPTEMTQEVL